MALPTDDDGPPEVSPPGSGGNSGGMLHTTGTDPAIEQAVTLIRDRFGATGLRAARDLINTEIARYADALLELAAD